MKREAKTKKENSNDEERIEYIGKAESYSIGKVRFDRDNKINYVPQIIAENLLLSGFFRYADKTSEESKKNLDEYNKDILDKDDIDDEYNKDILAGDDIN